VVCDRRKWKGWVSLRYLREEEALAEALKALILLALLREEDEEHPHTEHDDLAHDLALPSHEPLALPCGSIGAAEVTAEAITEAILRRRV
jgi:hypothetical protein